MLPRARNALRGSAWKKSTMWIGLMAWRTLGCCTIWFRPSSPSVVNHTTMTGPEDAADGFGAVTLHEEEADEDHAGQRDHPGLEGRGRDLEALDRAEHRDGRGDQPVAVEQRGAEHTEEHEAPHPASRGGLRDHQCRQGEDAALAVVVGAHDQGQVLDRDDDHERPEGDRRHAECVRLGDGEVLVLEGFAEGVEGAGADVAEHHAEGAEGDGAAAGDRAVPAVEEGSRHPQDGSGPRITRSDRT